MAASVGVLLGTLIFAPDRLLRFRPRWFDLPMLLWCLCGIASSLQNGLGIVRRPVRRADQSLTWGLPYLLGRMYFGDPEGLRYFAVAMVIGGLVLRAPLPLRDADEPAALGQDLRRGGGWQGIRLGGYRPQRLLLDGARAGDVDDGRVAGGLVAVALRRAQEDRDDPRSARCCCRSCWGRPSSAARPGRWPCWPAAWSCSGCRSASRRGCCWPASCSWGPVYVAVRATNLWTGQQAVDLAKAVVGPDRAQSLEYRFKCENLLAAKALQQPVFGWGGWGRSSVYFGDRRWRRRWSRPTGCGSSSWGPRDSSA